jgi:DnaJ family protein C protein 3
MRVSPLLSLPITILLAVQTLAQGRTAKEAAADGNRLLAEGAYSDAARAYGEAIGE